MTEHELPEQLAFDSWVGLPLTAFDTETDSANPTEARIVTACLVDIDLDGPKPRTEVSEWLLNIGCDIPEEASEVHGVSTEQMVRDGQDYSEGYAEIRNALETAWGRDRIVVAFNASFDLTLMDREGRRLGYPPLEVGPTFDPFTADRALDKYRKGKRTLTATCEHYNVRLDGAHSADEDALAAARLAWMLPRVYPDLALMSTDQLMRWQAEEYRFRQQDFREYLRRNGKTGDDVNLDWPLQL